MKTPYDPTPHGVTANEMMEETINKLYSAVTELEEIRDQFSPVHHPVPRWLSIAITHVETGTLWVKNSLNHTREESQVRGK